MGVCSVAIQVLIMKMTSSAIMKPMFSKPLFCLFALVGLLGSFPAFAMVEMKDEQLSEVTGQALLQMGKVQENGFTFYKAGLDAMLEINMNIEKLQLGCTSGSINSNHCDIDIDHFSLSGDCASRPDCSASLIRPFFEFAVKNDHEKTLREVTGIRLSAEQAFGLLTAGTENSATPNGINALSGYMVAQSDKSGLVKGYARTAATYYDATEYPLTGKLDADICVPIFGCGTLATASFETNGGGFWIPEINDPNIENNLYFEAPGLVVNGRRLSSVELNNGQPTFVNFPTLRLNTSYNPVQGSYNPNGNSNCEGNPSSCPLQTQGGSLDAFVTGCSGIGCIAAWDGRQFSNIFMYGYTENINVGITFDQSLGYIHKIGVDGSPFSLSFQKEAVKWPGSAAEDVAQKGWWMSFKDPVTIGNVNPQEVIDLGSEEIGPDFFPQLQSAISTYITDEPPVTTDIGGVLGGNGIEVNAGSIDLGSSPLYLGLSNLQLTGQNFTPNCYGSAKFC